MQSKKRVLEFDLSDPKEALNYRLALIAPHMAAFIDHYLDYMATFGRALSRNPIMGNVRLTPAALFDDLYDRYIFYIKEAGIEDAIGEDMLYLLGDEYDHDDCANDDE